MFSFSTHRFLDFPEVRLSRRPDSVQLVSKSPSNRSGERGSPEPDEHFQSRRRGYDSCVSMVAPERLAAAKDYKIAIAGVGSSAKRFRFSTIPSALQRSRQRDDNGEAGTLTRDWLIDDVQHVQKQKKKQDATNTMFDLTDKSNEEFIADDR